MDEPELRALIQTLTKRLLPEFEKVTEPEERVRLVLRQPELGADFAASLFAAEWPRKNEDVAKRNREDGNSAFTSGNHELAITLYTEAMKYAKVHETLWEGETMAIAAANRYTYYFTQNYGDVVFSPKLFLAIFSKLGKPKWAIKSMATLN